MQLINCKIHPKLNWSKDCIVWVLGISVDVCEYQGFLGTEWLKVNCLLEVAIVLRQLNPIHKKGP